MSANIDGIVREAQDEAVWSETQITVMEPELRRMGMVVVLDCDDGVTIYRSGIDVDAVCRDAKTKAVEGVDQVYRGEAVYNGAFCYNTVADIVRLLNADLRTLDALRRRAAVLGIRTYYDEEARSVTIVRPSGMSTDYDVPKGLSNMDAVISSLEKLTYKSNG